MGAEERLGSEAGRGPKWEAVFEDSKVLEGKGEEKGIVVTEMDATMLHSQEQGWEKLTVKLGMGYMAPGLSGVRSKLKRYWHAAPGQWRKTLM